MAEAPDTELFCRTEPLLQKAWDNTSVTLLKECPRKYQLAIIEGWIPQKTAAPLVFGGLLHRYLEAYDRYRLKGISHNDSLALVVSQALIETCRRVNGLLLPDGEVREVPPGTAGAKEEVIFWHGDNNRSRHTLIRSIVYYTEQFAVSDPLKTITLSSGQPALEISFRFMLPMQSPDAEPFIYCGHIDKICEYAGDLFIQERKHTTATLGDWYFIKYSIDGQTTGYLTAGKVLIDRPLAGIIVDACQVAVSFTRVHRHIAPRTEAQLEEWLVNVQEWISLAQYYARRYGARPWPLNEASCHKYAGCQYRGVCSRDPSMRPMLLQQHFKKARWNPLEIRSGADDWSS
jgi:hypothetical protein